MMIIVVWLITDLNVLLEIKLETLISVAHICTNLAFAGKPTLVFFINGLTSKVEHRSQSSLGRAYK